MRAQIVFDQRDLLSVGKMYVGQFLEHLRVIQGGAVQAALDEALAPFRRGAFASDPLTGAILSQIPSFLRNFRIHALIPRNVPILSLKSVVAEFLIFAPLETCRFATFSEVGITNEF